MGVVFKVFFVHRFAKVSLMTYLLMGWASVFIVRDMVDSLSHSAIVWLVAGGLCYTVGAVFYALKKIPYTHAIWHVFVLAGAACQALAIVRYVI
jgi:hemolysin III